MKINKVCRICSAQHTAFTVNALGCVLYVGFTDQYRNNIGLSYLRHWPDRLSLQVFWFRRLRRRCGVGGRGRRRDAAGPRLPVRVAVRVRGGRAGLPALQPALLQLVLAPAARAPPAGTPITCHYLHGSPVTVNSTIRLYHTPVGCSVSLQSCIICG